MSLVDILVNVSGCRQALTPALTPAVVGKYPERLPQPRGYQVPAVTVSPRTVDQHETISRTFQLIRETNAVDLDEGARVMSPRRAVKKTHEVAIRTAPT